jgi:hypothetical protein
LIYFDPYDAHVKSNNRKHVNLVFHLDTTTMNNITDISQISMDSFYTKALPAKIEYEKISPYFASCPHNIIQNTLRQTTQLAKSTIHYPMRSHQIRFHMLSKS